MSIAVVVLLSEEEAASLKRLQRNQSNENRATIPPFECHLKLSGTHLSFSWHGQAMRPVVCFCLLIISLAR